MTSEHECARHRPKSALEWLCRDEEQPWSGVIIFMYKTPWGPYACASHGVIAEGMTPAEAIVNCARNGGWGK